MVEFYLLTFPRFPLRKKEHKSYSGKNRTHDFRTSRCAAYLLDHSGDERINRLNLVLMLMLTHGGPPAFRNDVRRNRRPPSGQSFSPYYSLSDHAIAYRWRSPPRAHRHSRAIRPQGSLSNGCCLFRLLHGQLIDVRLLFFSLPLLEPMQDGKSKRAQLPIILSIFLTKKLKKKKKKCPTGGERLIR